MTAAGRGMAGILSINSAVSYGYVGNAVQVP